MSRAGARVVAVVQARMSSSRLPGKVLAELGEATTLDLVLDRLGAAREPAELVLATSEDHSDDPIERHAAARGTAVVRGPLADVLERYRLAVELSGADAVVRITADCPLVTPEVVDAVVAVWRADPELAYAWNTREPRTFPDGLDVEIVSADALLAAAAETAEPYDREHVTPFVRDRPDRFPHRSVALEPPARAVKLSLDTEADLATIRSFLARVGPHAGLAEIVAAAGGAPARMVTR